MKYQGKITDPKDLVTKEYVDTGLSGKQNALTFDDVPTAGSSNPVKSSGIKSAITHDLANIVATGMTNTTGIVIDAPTYFYLNGVLVQAKTRINIGEPFTLNTNYGVVTNGGLNQSSYTWFELTVTTSSTGSADLLFPSGKVVRHAYCTSVDIVIIPVTSQGSRQWIKALNWDMTAYANKTITVKGTYWNS